MSQGEKLTPRNGKMVKVPDADNMEECKNPKGSVSLHDAVYLIGSGTVSRASSSMGHNCIGFAVHVPNSTSCWIVTRGRIPRFGNDLIPGYTYYLGEKGKITHRRPKQKVQVVGFAWSETDFYVGIIPRETLCCLPQPGSTTGATGSKPPHRKPQRKNPPPKE